MLHSCRSRMNTPLRFCYLARGSCIFQCRRESLSLSSPNRIKSKIVFFTCGSVPLFISSLFAQQKPTIEVSSASYGVNLSKSASGNATKWVKSACDTKRSCFFAVKYAADAFEKRSSHEPKDFDFVYRCDDKVKKGHVNGDSRRKSVLLTCAD